MGAWYEPERASWFAVARLLLRRDLGQPAGKLVELAQLGPALGLGADETGAAGVSTGLEDSGGQAGNGRLGRLKPADLLSLPRGNQLPEQCQIIVTRQQQRQPVDQRPEAPGVPAAVRVQLGLKGLQCQVGPGNARGQLGKVDSVGRPCR